jgi:hypothetical protein
VPTGEFTWVTACAFACSDGYLLQGDLACVLPPKTEDLFKSTIQLDVAAAATYVCANINRYVSEYCAGLSATNPGNSFSCKPSIIDGVLCTDGVCQCGDLARRRLLGDTCQLVIAASCTSTSVSLPEAIPWVQSAAVIETTGGPPPVSVGGPVAGSVVAVLVLCVGGFFGYRWYSRRRAADGKKVDSPPTEKSEEQPVKIEVPGPAIKSQLRPPTHLQISFPPFFN